jgi:hypothetical protein
MLNENISVPLSVLKQAIKAVPAVKYALGVGGIVSVVAIVVGGFKIDIRVAVFGSIIMFVLMVVLVIFAKLTGQASSNIYTAAMVFTWFCLILFMATAGCLFWSVFFGKPVDLRSVWASEKPLSEVHSEAPTARDSSLTKSVGVQSAENVYYDQYEANDANSRGDNLAATLIEGYSCVQHFHCTDEEKRNIQNTHDFMSSQWFNIRRNWEKAIELSPDENFRSRVRAKLDPHTALSCKEFEPGRYSCFPDFKEIADVLRTFEGRRKYAERNFRDLQD